MCMVANPSLNNFSLINRRNLKPYFFSFIFGLFIDEGKKMSSLFFEFLDRFLDELV